MPKDIVQFLGRGKYHILFRVSIWSWHCYTPCVQILPEMIGRASKLFHNVKTALPAYTDLEAFHKANYDGKVKDISRYTHELRWIKSPSELKLMRQSASIACQVFIILLF